MFKACLYSAVCLSVRLSRDIHKDVHVHILHTHTCVCLCARLCVCVSWFRVYSKGSGIRVSEDISPKLSDALRVSV